MKHDLRRLLAVFALATAMLAAMPATAQEPVAQAYPMGLISHQGAGHLTLALDLSAPVEHRVFVLDDPARLIVDFRDLDWSAFDSDGSLRAGASAPEAISGLRFGVFQPGWSRLVVDLAEPHVPEQVMMTPQGQGGRLSILLRRAEVAEFAAMAGLPGGQDWQAVAPVAPLRGPDDLPVIALDPGHGGVDPGAIRLGILEKDLTLTFAIELRDALLETDRYAVVMTRDEDVFVSLRDRMRVARTSAASVFVSLHANTIESGTGARGSSVFTLSEQASDDQARMLAEFENRSDLVAGAELDGAEDTIAQVLLDLAQIETDHLSAIFADVMVERLLDSQEPGLKSRRMSAGFRVLRAPDVPSVLVELGFMSNRDDLYNMRDPGWRQTTIAAMIEALDRYFELETEARSAMRR